MSEVPIEAIAEIEQGDDPDTAEFRSRFGDYVNQWLTHTGRAHSRLTPRNYGAP
jgi:hypothetical protein